MPQTIDELALVTIPQEGSHVLAPLPAAQQKATATAWAGNQPYLQEAYVTAVVSAVTYVFCCVTAGTSGGSAPSWVAVVGATTVDGSAVWVCLGSVVSSNAAVLNDPSAVQVAAYVQPWAPSTVYAAGLYVSSPKTGWVFSGTGGTSGATAPAWPYRIGATTASDNGIIWTCIAPPLAQVLPQGYLVQGANTPRALANRPWTKRGRAQYIGRPIVQATVQNLNECTPPSYFATAYEDPHPGGIEVSVECATWGGGAVVLERCMNADCIDGNGNPVAETWNVLATYNANTETTVQHYNFSIKYRLRVSVALGAAATARLSQV
jgi:hypothetical protein